MPRSLPEGSTTCYFVRDPSKFITADSIDSSVFFGTLKGQAGGDVMQSLLSSMQGMYLPVLLGNNGWPEAVRADFTGQIHKFMATLTESVHQSQGNTVLYIPKEDYGDIRAAAKQKDLVQRLESTIIHWTRQIKGVLNQQDSNGNGASGGAPTAESNSLSSGPLSEIEFWRERAVDLGGIRKQLDDGNVAVIVSVLETARSSYLAPFLSLRNLISKEAVAAEDNLKFLLCLEDPCKALSKALPEEIPALLPPIVNCIRLVWSLSRFYNTPERITVLLRKLSDEIIARCSATIELPAIFTGEVDGVFNTLNQCIAAGVSWKSLYASTAQAVSLRSPKPWDFDVSSIFAHIDAFLQRCHDLLDVCQAQRQFAPLDPLPMFGGTQGPETRKSILDIHESFAKLVKGLKSVKYNILDVKATAKWHTDFNTFKASGHYLESSVGYLNVNLSDFFALSFPSSTFTDGCEGSRGDADQLHDLGPLCRVLPRLPCRAPRVVPLNGQERPRAQVCGEEDGRVLPSL